METSFFNNLKQTKEPSTSKSKTPIEKIVSDTLVDDARELSRVQAQIAALTAECDILTTSVKSQLIEHYVSVYDTNSCNPGTLKIEMVDTEEKQKATASIIPTDGYLKVKNKERADFLKTKYGNDIITEKESVSFDMELLKKYEKVIAKFLTTNKEIAEEDRGRLVNYTAEYSITKGCIDRLHNHKTNKRTINEVVHDLGVIFQLKNVKDETIVREVKEESPVVIPSTTKSSKKRQGAK